MRFNRTSIPLADVGNMCVYIAVIILSCVHIPVYCDVVSLDGGNLQSILSNNEVVFVNFYADWCRFSQMLTPVFKDASDKFKDVPPGKVVFASVDCDRQPDIAQKFHVSKYPTLKLFRNGEMVKREYRGQRSAEALESYIKQQTTSVLKKFATNAELEQHIDKKRRNVIGYFIAEQGEDFDNLRKVASTLREECDVWVGVGKEFSQETLGGNNVAFRPPNTQHEDQIFSGDLKNSEYLKEWITDKCIPLVREITFENAEELTEEGLPFLILFRNADDRDSERIYTEQVASQLGDQKTSINALVADGKKFAHPLHHLGKSESDLPLLAIDSFRHMYLFPDMTQLTTPGKLRDFVSDLHSGKLHREFHHGPDPTQPGATDSPHAPAVDDGGQGHEQVPSSQDGRDASQTDPPESVFKQLKPSQNRYTLLKDEL